MDARQFFDQIVRPDCEEAMRPPLSLRSAYHAIWSLNAATEFLALHRLEYEDVPEGRLNREADNIRKQHPALAALNREAIKMKHVRRLKDKEPLSASSSSTGYSIADPTPADLVKIIHDAFEVLIRLYAEP